jgi:DNA mismatch repair protein MutS2
MPSLREKTLVDLGWSQLLDQLAARCHTSRGAAAARALPFFDEPGPAEIRLAEIAEARLLWQLNEPVPFGGIHDVETLLGRAEKGGDLVGTELVPVAETVAGIARLKRHLVARAAQVPRLAEQATPLEELPHVSGPILDSIEEGGRLADHASGQLGPLRRRVASLHEELGRKVKTLLLDPAIEPYLQDNFYTQREERYVVPLRAEARTRVPGIVHGTSQSGQTVFVEPEAIVELNNRLKMAESDVADEERRILAELSGFVREEVPAIRAGLAVAQALDLVDGAARLADALDASAPALDPGKIELRRARHPLMVLAGRPCVPNDLELAAGKTLVISGPNAGGKTVALKTLGLVALMARAGLHVPADAGSTLPFYTRVQTDIGDDQSIERNLSTFSAHIHHLREFLAEADAQTLLLVDELAVGTDPEQGGALAQAVLEHFAARGGQAIVTTHYERLKALPTQDERFVNASVGFDLEKMAPTFKLHIGVPGSSGALLVARRFGLPPELVARAEGLLGDRRAGIEELLTAVAEERRRLDLERAAADTARREAERARRDAEGAERAAKAREVQLRKGAHDDAVAALRRTRDELDGLKQRLKKGDREDLTAAKAELAEAAGKIAAHAPAGKSAGPGGRPLGAEEIVPGMAVVVASLGGRGQVVAAPEKGRVAVLIGVLRTTVSVEDLRVDDKPVSKVPAPRRRAAAATVSSGSAGLPPDADLAPARTADATLDLRGERVDDALNATTRFVDECLLASREVVFIIHGFGTGALRSAVRDHIAALPGVVRWRPGQEKEGGDGVTVVWLDV